MIRLCQVHSQSVKEQQQILLPVSFIMSEGKILSRKLVIIGDGGVGKTTLLEVLNTGKYVEYKRRKILNAAECLKRINHPTLEGVEIELQL